MKAAKVNKASKKLADKKITLGFLARLCFARYYVWDNYGTRELCWTKKEAIEWLKVCGSVAVIGDRWRQKVIVSRCYTASWHEEEKKPTCIFKLMNRKQG